MEESFMFTLSQGKIQKKVIKGPFNCESRFESSVNNLWTPVACVRKRTETDGTPVFTVCFPLYPQSALPICADKYKCVELTEFRFLKAMFSHNIL